MNAQLMPVLFLGHGSPMNAIEDNVWSRGFRALGGELPKPGAILCVSAHWYVGGRFVTAVEKPRTIHDFGGFPQELYRMLYPAPGSPALASRVIELLAGFDVGADRQWGLDHGTWTVLRHLYPDADVPVVQLSIDAGLEPEEHLRIGGALAALSGEGVMVVGSGNVVHNLGDAFSRMSRGDETTPEWAEKFDALVEGAVLNGDNAALTEAYTIPLGEVAHPTPDHYLPLLYCAGAGMGRPVSFPLTGFSLGSLSMRAVLWS